MLRALSAKAVAPARAASRRAFSALLTLEEEFPGSPTTSPSRLPAAKTTVSTLPNGVTLVSTENGDKVASVGLLVKAGTRDESLAETGATLLLQRLAFKSTTKRSALRLNRDLENRGVYVSCTAGREQTVYSAQCLPDAVDYAVDALAETVLTPRLTDFELEEVMTHAENIDMEEYRTSADLLISEALHAAAFDAASPLGHPFYAKCELGVPALSQIAAARAAPSRVVLAGVGVSHTELESIARVALGDAAGSSSASAGSKAQSKFLGGETRVAAQGALTHVALAFEGPAAGEKDRAFAVLAALLDLRVRAAHPATASFATAYSDTGLLGVTGAAPSAAVSALVQALVSTLKGAASTPASGTELKAAVACARLAAMKDSGSGGSSVAVLASGVAFGGNKGGDSAWAGLDGVSGEAVAAAAKKLLKTPLALAAVGDIKAVPRRDAIVDML